MLKNFRSSHVLELNDLKQAAELLDPNTLRFLGPFIGKTCSADQVARELGISLNTLLYQINRLIDLGFLEIIEQKPRRGRAIKRYRASADTYFIPFEATSFAIPEDMLLREYEPLYRHFLASFLEAAMQMVHLKTARDIGMCVSRHEDGTVKVQHGAHPARPLTLNPLEPNAPAILIDWEDQLRLDFEDAKNLQLEMFELLERYRTKNGSGSYIAHMALAPMKSHG
jgi:biotin operon repressor